MITKNKHVQSKISYCILAISLSISPFLSAYSFEQSPENTLIETEQQSLIKQQLISKLDQIDFFTANFTQLVVDAEGNTVQKGSGTLAISKPNLVNWHTTEPDESLIVSDGKDLWFYDPWIEQASIYSLDKAINNTPILLLTNNNKALWENYQVTLVNENVYSVNSLDSDSQVKSLELTFNEHLNKQNQLTKISFLDATGQLSHISLLQTNFTDKPANDLFHFVLPEGVTVDDQR